MSAQFDLLIRAGRVYCSDTGFEGPGAVAMTGDRIAACDREVTGDARTTLDFPHDVLLPGLVDLHAHPAREGSKYGVDPDLEFLPRGVTTVMSQGDAGADNWARYRETTIAASRTRVRLAINLSRRGESVPGGCCENIDDCDVHACVAAIEDGGDDIWGVSANVGEIACGATEPREVMRRALQVAERTRRPLLYGMRRHDQWPMEEQLALLRPGDVVTYCFRPEPGGIVANGRVHPAASAAHERGVLFDVGHGMNSFDFNVAAAALADGFAPDTISSDQYLKHVGSQPQHDLPRVMSKMIAAGMTEADAFAAVTRRPACVLGLAGEIGTLRVGACADLTVLRWNESGALADAFGAQRVGGCWEAVLTVRAGQPIETG